MFLDFAGAHCLKNLISIQNEFHKEYAPQVTDQPVPQNSTGSRLEAYANKLQSDEIASVYPQKEDAPDRLDLTDLTLNSREAVMLSQEKEM